MSMRMRRLGVAAAFVVLLAACGESGGDTTTSAPSAFPSQAIEFATASNPGAGSDTMLRALLSSAEEAIPVSTYVVNRAGGGGANLAGYVNGRPADGYTVAAVTTSNVLSNVTDVLGMDLLVDWQPVMRLMVDPTALVVPADAPWTTMEELVAAMQAGEVAFGGSNVGSLPHIGFALLATQVDAPTDRYVAFDASGDALPALLGGHFDAMFAQTSEVTDFVTNGELRALLVESEVPGFEGVPTFAGSPYEDALIGQWRGLFVRTGTPEAAVTFLHDTFKNAIELPESPWQEYLQGGGAESAYLGPDDFLAFVTEQNNTIAEVLREFGIID